MQLTACLTRDHQLGIEGESRIKHSTRLTKLTDAYCKRLGLQGSQVRFTVGGESIAPADKVEKLGLEYRDFTEAAAG